MFTVNFTGKEKSFSSKDIAIRFMDTLDVGSDLWLANTLLRSRVKQPAGTFEVTVYDYDDGRALARFQEDYDNGYTTEI